MYARFRALASDIYLVCDVVDIENFLTQRYLHLWVSRAHRLWVEVDCWLMS